MAITTFTGDMSAVFAAGTTLQARPASNWPAHKRPPAPGSTPVGSVTASAASASSGVLSLTGLADSTVYYVSDSGGTKYVRITTFPQTTLLRSNDTDVERLGTAQTRTQALTITPASGVPLTVNPPVDTDGQVLTVGANTSAAHAGLHISDSAGRAAGPLQEIDSYGTGNSLDIHWFPANPVGTTGGCAFGIHAYRDPGAGQAAFILDNTDAGASIKLKNTEGVNNPNSWGRGNFFEWYAYQSLTTPAATGAITSGQAALVMSAPTFAAKDVGKPIVVVGAGAAAGNLNTTILSFTDSTHVTLATNASTTVTTAAVRYATVADVNRIAYMTGAPPSPGSITAANRGALRFINTQTGTGQLSASPWSFETSTGACTALEVYQPSGSAGGLLINHAGTGYGLGIQKSGTNVFVLTPTGTDGANVAVGTTTGFKLGTATTQKIGFFNATPVVQQSAGTTATDAASTQTLANALRTALVNLGLAA